MTRMYILSMVVIPLILVSCNSAQGVDSAMQAGPDISTPFYTSTPTPEAEKTTQVAALTPMRTLMPSATIPPTTTPTPRPTLQPVDFVDGSLVIPGVPVLEEKGLLDAALENYFSAMGLTTEQVEIRYQLLTGESGRKAVVALALPVKVPMQKYAQLYGPTPLIIAYIDDSNGKWQWQPLGLRDVAGLAGKKIGTTAPWMRDATDQAKQFLIREFNTLAIENSFDWKNIEPTRGEISPKRDTQIRNVINFAQQNSMEVMGGPILGWDDKPEWIVAEPHTADELDAMLREHVRLILLQYPEIKYWGISNEFHSLSKGWHDDPIQRKFIEANQNPDEILRIVFDEARKVRPDAILILSDNGNETTAGLNYARNYKFSKWLRELNVLDMISMHMHLIGSEPPSKDRLVRAMQSYKDIDVQVRIGELDVVLKGIKGEDRFLRQASIYKDAVSALLETDAGDVIVTWNYGDNQSWLENTSIGLGDRVSPDNDPTMFGDAPLLKPKPAYYAVLQAFYEYLLRNP